MSEEYGNDFVTLTDEEGNEYEFEILKEIEIDGTTYVALLPADDDDDEDDESEDIYLVRIAYDGDDELYEVIEDDAEYDKVAAVFEKAFAEDQPAEETDGCDCGCHDCDCGCGKKE